MQIPAVVGEGCTLSCVEIATHSCFHGVSEIQMSWEIILIVDDKLRLEVYHRVTYTIYTFKKQGCLSFSQYRGSDIYRKDAR